MRKALKESGKPHLSPVEVVWLDAPNVQVFHDYTDDSSVSDSSAAAREETVKDCADRCMKEAASKPRSNQARIEAWLVASQEEETMNSIEEAIKEQEKGECSGGKGASN